MADLQRFRTLARNWEALGHSDPMFGVLSDPTKHGGKWDPDEFFASGRAHVKQLLQRLTEARASFEPGTCLDFGCGVGRLTLPLSESFHRTIGVDVARPMIEAARIHQPPGSRCEFIVNRDPDLGRFQSGTFDMVHSCLVLQHIPPDMALCYIAEFFRVSKSGGLVVFQVPADTFTESQISASYALPDSAYEAEITVGDVTTVLDASAFIAVPVQITNRGDLTWQHDIPAGRHICLGNHWLREDGSRAVDDDARALLPHSVGPGESVQIVLRVQAPDAPGKYLLEVDLVQEHICWFNQRGSATARAHVTVAGARPSQARPEAIASATTSSVAPQAPRPRRSLVKRLIGRLGQGTPTFEMHAIPRPDVERTIESSGGLLLRAVDDNAAGAAWLSYTYVCRRQ